MVSKASKTEIQILKIKQTISVVQDIREFILFTIKKYIQISIKIGK